MLSFVFRFSEGIARARERRAAKPRDARNEGGSPRSLSRLAPSAMCVVRSPSIFLCRAFCSTDWEKRKTAPSVWKTCNFVAKPRSHFRILLYQTWAISHSKVTRETGSALCRIAPWDCFGEAVASFIGRLRIHLPFPRPLSPLPESHGAIRHNKAKY